MILRHPVIAAAGRFLIGTIGLLLVASVLIFALVRSAPGDPVEIEFGSTGADAYLTPEQQAQAREQRRGELGLDGPIVIQYLLWLDRVVRFDLGVSYRTGQPVGEEIFSRLPASIALGATGFAVAMFLAIAMGLLGARRPGSVTDHAIRFGTLAVATVPTFLSGSILLRWAAERFDYPLAGEATMAKLWLPALVIGLSSMATMSRLLRASLIAERSSPYAAAAVARGAGPTAVLLRHVGRPVMTPVLTLAGLAFAGLVAGSVITETVFSWPGVSAYAVGAIADQDYAVVQAYVLLVVAVVVMVNRAVDAAQSILDPRVDQRAKASI